MKEGIIALGAALVLLASPTFAGDYDKDKSAEYKKQDRGMEQAAQQPQQEGQRQAQQLGQQQGQQQNNLAASQLIGAEVQDAAGEDIGEVQDLVISPDQQKVQAVIEVGATLGMGGRTVAIDASELRLNADGSAIELNRTQQELEAMPEFDLQANTRQMQAGR